MSRMRILCGLIIAILTGAVAASPSPPPPEYRILVETRGATPIRMWIERLGQRDIHLEPVAGGFGTTWPVGGQRLTERATLLAEYSDERISLPIRLVPGSPDMRLRIYNQPRLPCTRAVRERLNASRSDLQTLLEAYFHAKKLATYRGMDQCQGDARAQFERLWYDLSYELGRRSEHIDLDGMASFALAQTAPAHVALFDGQMAARLAQLDFAHQRELQANNDPLQAWHVNEALTEALNADPEYAAAVAEYQDLRAPDLALEARRIENSLAAIGVAAPQ